MNTRSRSLAVILCIATAPATAVAQPTLSAIGFTPLAGEVHSYSSATFQPVGAGTGGSNAVWDYGSVEATSFEVVSFMQPSAGAYGTSFPLAAVMRKTSQEQYYNMPAGSMERIGTMYDAGVVTSCADAERMMQFPFTYGDSFVDSFHCTFISGVWGTRTGYDSVWADGWGKLILPGDEYTDVLRVRIKSRYNDTIAGQPVVTYTDDQTHFYKPGVHAPLLSIRDALASAGGSVLETRKEFRFTNMPADIANLAGVKEAIRISPVPAAGFLNVDVEHTHDRPIRLELWNSTGQVVRQGTLEAGSLHASIHCADLARGMYFLRCADGASSVAKQVVLQ